MGSTPLPLSTRRSAAELAGTRLMAFSYGSGLASTLYALRFSSDPAHLERLIANAAEVLGMLESRRAVPPAEFEQTLKLREETPHLAPYRPVGGRGSTQGRSFSPRWMRSTAGSMSGSHLNWTKLVCPRWAMATFQWKQGSERAVGRVVKTHSSVVCVCQCGNFPFHLHKVLFIAHS